MTTSTVESVSRRPATRKVRLVPFSRTSHRDGVSRLAARVFGAGSVSALWERCHWVDAMGAEESPRWVLERGGDVVGFLGTVALPYRIAGETVVAHTPAEYMVHPDHRFHGLRLMRRFMEACPSCVTCDDIEDTIRVTEWLGVPRVTRLARVRRLLDAEALRTRSRWAARAPDRALRAITGVMRRLDARGLRGRWPPELGPVQIDGFDDRFDDLFARQVHAGSASVRRDRRFLEWRYGPRSPHAERVIGAVPGPGGRLRGYTVVHRSRRAGRVGRVLDLQVAPGEPTEVAHALVAWAVDTLRRLGAWSVRLHHLETDAGPAADVAATQRFAPTGGYWLMVRLPDPALQAVAGRPDRWRLGFGDVEASFAER